MAFVVLKWGRKSYNNDLVAIILFWVYRFLCYHNHSAEKFDFMSQFSAFMSSTRRRHTQATVKCSSREPSCPTLSQPWPHTDCSLIHLNLLDFGVGFPARRCTVAVHYSNCSRTNWKSCKSACLIAIIWKHLKVCAALSELVTIQFIDN